MALATRSLLAAVLTSTVSLVQAAKDADDYPQKNSQEASVLRGDIVFQAYCALCHGVHADGRGRAARIYDPRPANLRESAKPDAYKDLIIRKGGKAVGRSQYMPPWGDELTDEQIGDVVRYLRSIAPPNAPR
jgi:mono/diheme cytochrome c family protein